MAKLGLTQLILLSAAVLHFSCAYEQESAEELLKKASAETNTFSFLDSRNGQTYKSVRIGSRIWFAENLNYDVPDETTDCYDNKEENCKKYGRLYNWKTAMKACPAGWRLPSIAEWNVLLDYVDYGAAKLKAESFGGTDDYGFSALPGGEGSSAGSYKNIGVEGSWWSSDESETGYAYFKYMSSDMDYALESSGYKSFLYSVRCILNN